MGIFEEFRAETERIFGVFDALRLRGFLGCFFWGVELWGLGGFFGDLEEILGYFDIFEGILREIRIFLREF